MQRLVAVLMFVLVASVAASAALARSPKDPVYRPNARDLQVARTLLLARADIPQSYRDKGADTSTHSGTGVSCDELQSDQHRLVQTADVDGHVFQEVDRAIGLTEVSSAAVVFRSVAEATSWYAASKRISNSAMSRCLEAGLRSGLPKGTPVTGFRLRPLHQNDGRVEMLGWEVVAAFQVNGKWVPIDVVSLFLRRGRAISYFAVTRSGAGKNPDVARFVYLAATKLRSAPVTG